MGPPSNPLTHKHKHNRAPRQRKKQKNTQKSKKNKSILCFDGCTRKGGQRVASIDVFHTKGKEMSLSKQTTCGPPQNCTACVLARAVGIPLWFVPQVWPRRVNRRQHVFWRRLEVPAPFWFAHCLQTLSKRIQSRAEVPRPAPGPTRSRGPRKSTVSPSAPPRQASPSPLDWRLPAQRTYRRLWPGEGRTDPLWPLSCDAYVSAGGRKIRLAPE